jgi:AcrR family transcriptional regulator
VTQPETMAARRRRLVRTDLARVAIGLFAERGFDAVTVDDIAAAAGISGRTFFRYFATKDEVVLDYGRHLRERLLTALDDRPPAEGAVTALRNAFLSTSRVSVEDRARFVQIGRILQAAPGLRDLAEAARGTGDEPLVERVAARMGVDPRRDAAPRTIVAAMTAVAGREWRAWVEDGGEGDPAERIAAGLALVERGFASLDEPKQARNRRSA